MNCSPERVRKARRTEEERRAFVEGLEAAKAAAQSVLDRTTQGCDPVCEVIEIENLLKRQRST
jgi:hypothetical protein